MVVVGTELDPPETLTVPLITTVFGMVAVTVCDAASHTNPPVTPDACVVVVGTLLDPPETETVPEMTTVLETLTVPLTAADTVWVGASQINPPVAAAWVVVVGTELDPPDTETVPEITTVLETLTVPLTAADTV